MNTIDIFILVVVGVSALYGLIRGFVHIALGIAGFGIGLAAALRLADRGPEWFGKAFSSPATARLAAFGVVMVGTLIVTALVIWIGGKLIRAAGIGWMDRVAGAVIGIAGGLLAVIGIMLTATTFFPPGSSLLRESRLLPRVLGAVDLASLALPPGLAAAYQERRQALAGKMGDAAPPAPQPKAAPAKPEQAPAKPAPPASSKSEQGSPP